ncbi:MAG TPA: SH3 domain-containing protein [Geobacteraceae bacterium]|nr:SH3 domain-containing protein [Geobacteraceae bacterium]
MSRSTFRKSIHTIVTLILCSCAPSWSLASGTRISDDYEIRDVQVLPQDMRTYASNCSSQALAPGCRDFLLADFLRNQYSPWRESVPRSHIADAVQAMREHAQWTWYGENRRKVSPDRLAELLANCDLERLPSMDRPAVALSPSSMRVLPTTVPFLKKADDFPFDRIQNAAVAMNEPLRVLHVSADGLWVFVKGPDASGWVESRDVGYINEAQAGEWMNRELMVVVRDGALLSDANGGAIATVKVGALFPRVGENGNFHIVSVAIPSDGHQVRVVNARIPKDSAQRFPLDLNREGVAMVGNQLLGKPYGWGGLYHNRDCSSMIRDFFLPFGIWLPRGSYNQIHSGNAISLNGLSNDEKERVLREKGVPFLTLVYLKGHIMLYVGNINGRPLVFHSSWGVSLSDGEGSVSKHVIGKSIVSTLTPGSELDLASGTLLDKVRSILVLGNCPASRSQVFKEGNQ